MTLIIFLNSFFVFYLGCIIGSFIGVLVNRTYRKLIKLYNEADKKNLSEIKILIEEFKLLKFVNEPKRSYCDYCKKQLKWYHNIPLFSYIFLKGKCAYCNHKISPELIFIEIFTGLTHLLLYLLYIKNVFTLNEIILLGFSNIFIISSIFIDLKSMFIPDSLLILAAIPGLFLNFINNNFTNIILFFIIIAFGYFLTYLSIKFFKKIYFGLQDIKLISIFMLFLNYKFIYPLIVISTLIAFPFSIYFLIKNRNKVIPFGIYLYLSFLIILILKMENINIKYIFLNFNNY